MRVLYIFILSIIFACNAPQPEEAVDLAKAKVERQEQIKAYDSVKAKAYGADDYGMKRYVVAFLMLGPNRPSDSAKAAELQSAHLANINRLAEAGKLVLAGPFFGNDSLRGIYVFDTESVAEAKKLTESDPAIQEGSLKMVLKPWYGSAALMGINEVHKSISKKNI